MSETLRITLEKCWPFSAEETPPYPTIEVEAVNPAKPATRRKASFKVDTGYNALITVTRKLAKELELKPVGSVAVSTALGPREALLFRLGIKQDNLAVEKETLAVAAERLLVGRELLSQGDFLLDFSANRFCVIRQAS